MRSCFTCGWLLGGLKSFDGWHARWNCGKTNHNFMQTTGCLQASTKPRAARSKKIRTDDCKLGAFLRYSKNKIKYGSRIIENLRFLIDDWYSYWFHSYLTQYFNKRGENWSNWRKVIMKPLKYHIPPMHVAALNSLTMLFQVKQFSLREYTSVHWSMSLHSVF